MSKRKDKPAYAFIRVGNRLLPDMDFDLGALEGVAEGEKVRVEVSQWRNRPRLRAYWAMLRECILATECAPNVDALHKTIKLGVGLVDHVKLKGGDVLVIPASIAIEAMPEHDMISYFRSAEKWLSENIGFSARNIKDAG